MKSREVGKPGCCKHDVGFSTLSLQDSFYGKVWKTIHGKHSFLLSPSLDFLAFSLVYNDHFLAGEKTFIRKDVQYINTLGELFSVNEYLTPTGIE